MVRSAVLTNYAEIARSVGLDPYQMVQSVGLSQACLVERDLKIPTTAVRRLLEDSAALSGVENFGLRMAETRRLSILGQLGMVARDAPTVRHLMDIIAQYMRVHNESLLLRIEEAGGLATIRQDLLVNERGSMHQSVELSLGAVMRVLRIFLGDDWSAAAGVLRAPEPGGPEPAPPPVRPGAGVRLRVRWHRLQEQRPGHAHRLVRPGDGRLRAPAAGKRLSAWTRRRSKRRCASWC